MLVAADTADVLKLQVGDQAEVVLARGTAHQQQRTMRVAGLFTRFPGFPGGVQIVVNLGYYQSQTGIHDVDFFLARATNPDHVGLAAATRAITAGPGASDALNVDTTESGFNKDQSSLTALNIRGLLSLDSFYTLTMCAAVIAIFVIGLMLQRRKEYVILTAQGLTSRGLRALLLCEAVFVAVSGLASGLLVGTGLGVLLVKVLKPLFILAPRTTIAHADAAQIVALVLLATLVSVTAAHLILRSLRPSEVLREQ
jgi:ABC-type antimicrobial peptide transport system permease subunit